MKISVIGTGYVGLVTGACFAEMGNSVTCMDTDKEKINHLKNGIIPIYEPGLDSLIARNTENGFLKFTTEMNEAMAGSAICFIAVGTPMGEDGHADLKHVLEVARSIGRNMIQHMYVIDKSTVPVGTADKVREVIHDELKKRKAALTFEVISNPEFLKEGSAVEDFMRPDRVIIGTEDQKAIEIMKEVYAPFTHSHERFISMDIKSAEMTKYTANALLATKISFINEIANICERVGADANKVRIGIGSDSRIGYQFIYPGCGYGGSCLPKDVHALAKTAQKYGYEPVLIHAVEKVNKAQKSALPNKVIRRFGDSLEGLVFAVWGLSFKPGTDDMREAPSITIINELTERGAKIKAFDPKAMDMAKRFYLKNNKKVTYVKDKYMALQGADALLLVTEWKEFRSPDFEEIRQRLKTPIIFDGRNQYLPAKLKELGFEYYQIGV